MGDFHISKCSDFLMLFYIGASATKSCERSRIFRYGFPKDIFSKGEKTREEVGTTAPPPWVNGLRANIMFYF